MAEKEKVLVVGGNGFIGSHLVDALLDDNYQVSVYDLSKDKIRGELDDVTYYYGSIEEMALLERAVEPQEIIIHLVSTTVPGSSNKNMAFDIRTNLIASVNLLQIMKNLGKERIIYLSSGGTVYGNTETYPIPESHILEPISSYGIVKLAVEKYLLMFQELYGLKPLIFRPANIYGPRQNIDKPQGVTGHFIKNILLGKEISVWGDGEVRKDYLYVNDLVTAIIKGIESRKQGIFNIGSGSDDSINDIIDILKEFVDFEIDYQEARQFDVKKVSLDITAIKKELDWLPKVSLKEGVKAQYDWMKNAMTKS